MTIVAVTGANGFIGMHLLEEFASRGIQGCPLVRSQRLGAPPLVPGAQAVDYEDAAGLRQAIQGVDAVVHLLGQAHDSGAPPDIYEKVNVLYTSRVVQACEASGVRRLVYVSSVKVIGNGQAEPYTDDTDPRPEDAYGRSKLKGENIVRERAGVGGFDYVILRPPLVYGAGVKGNLRRLIRNVQRGYPIPIPRPTPRPRSLISARNFASAIADTIEWRGAIRRAYLVADEADVTLPELVDCIAKVSGCPARMVPVPIPLLRGIATLAGQGRVANRIVGSLRVDSRPFRATFGWVPRSSLEEGLREAIGASPS